MNMTKNEKISLTMSAIRCAVSVALLIVMVLLLFK